MTKISITRLCALIDFLSDKRKIAIDRDILLTKVGLNQEQLNEGQGLIVSSHYGFSQSKKVSIFGW